MKKLIVVDMQNDFISGTLAVKGAQKIIPAVNSLIAKFVSNGLPVIYTQDWHKLNHPSFEPFGGMWPIHCVADSWGARFDRRVVFPAPEVCYVVKKGFDLEEYGANLVNYVRRTDDVYIVGLCTDFCVRETGKNVLNLGKNVFVVSDATESVGLQAESLEVCAGWGMQVTDSKSIQL